MANVIKVSLAGINALTNTNPKNFSLYVDGTTNHVLVKEKTRDTIQVDDFGTETIEHGLDYPPFTAQMVQVSAGEFQWVYNDSGGSFSPFGSFVTDEDLILGNNDSVARLFSYIIFYDQI